MNYVREDDAWLLEESVFENVRILIGGNHGADADESFLLRSFSVGYAKSGKTKKVFCSS